MSKSARAESEYYGNPHFTCDIFGNWQSYESYLRAAGERSGGARRLVDMSYDQMLRYMSLLSKSEIEEQISSFMLETDDDESKEGGRDYGEVYEDLSHVVYWLGDPPPEAALDHNEVDPQTKRFCRVRHQIHLVCGGCDHALRRCVTWTSAGEIVYPGFTLCPMCPAPEAMNIVGEAYVAKMPAPFGYDPEPLRTEKIAEAALQKFGSMSRRPRGYETL